MLGCLKEEFMNKFIFCMMFLLYSSTAYTQDDGRVLIKIPYQDREEILRGMRKYLKITEKILLETSKNNYSEIERVISKIEVDKERLNRLSTRENIEFMELAYKFHDEEVKNIKESAKNKNQAEMILAISKFIKSCTHCHDRFRLIEWGDKKYPAAKPNKIFIEKYIKNVK